MLVGFGLQDSISDIAAIQYRELQHYDGMVIEDSDATEEEHEELFEYMKENEQNRPLQSGTNDEDQCSERQLQHQYLSVCAREPE